MLKINKLILKGSKRLLSKGTLGIEWDLVEDIQLVLGTNGYGKSTLLEECSPLPPVPNEYTKTGYKEVLLTFNDVDYRLVSDFSSTHKHSFKRLDTGEELNDGGTLTIQRTLVKNVFKYTQKIHDLLIGKVEFTSMGPQARQEWISDICDVDVSYALDVYERLRREYRDLIGARKHNQQKLLAETSRLMSEEDRKVLLEQISQLEADSHTLLTHLDNNLRLTDEDRQRQKDLGDEIDELSNLLLDADATDLSVEFENRDLALEHLSELKRQYSNATERRQSLQSQYGEIEKQVALLSDEKEYPLEQLRSDIAKLKAEYESADKTPFELIGTRSDYEDFAIDIAHLGPEIDAFLLKLPPNPNCDFYSRAKHEALQEKKRELAVALNHKQNALGEAERRKEHLDNHRPSKCPKCEHVWIEGVSDQELLRLDQKILEANRAIESIKKELSDVGAELEDSTQWITSMRQLSGYVAANPRLTPFWNALRADDRLYNNPAGLSSIGTKWIQIANDAAELYKKSKEITRLESILSKRSQLESDNFNYFDEKLNTLEQGVQQALAELKRLKSEIQTLEEKLRHDVYLYNLTTELKSKYEQYVEGIIQTHKVNINELIREEASAAAARLATLSKRRNEASGIERIIEHIESTLDDLNTDLDVYEAVIDGLSPTKGLIADVMLGFIKNMVGQANNIIEMVWTVKLKMRSCSIVNGKLDYKFPVDTIEAEYPMKDIANGSRGEKEILNFVLRLVTISAMGYEGYPIALDEVGSGFHETHRRRLFDLIKTLVDVKKTSQVLTVSHFSSTHDALTRAQVSVIDPTGVLVRPEDNQHFKIL